MYINRIIEDHWKKAAQQFPVLLLTGARQVGKTTVLKHLCGPERRYVTLDDPVIRALAHDDPEMFLQRYQPPVLLDEIQYAPNLLTYIKMSVDAEHRPSAYWITGSQQFQLMKGVAETLAGRVGIVRLLGFSDGESRLRLAPIEAFLPTTGWLYSQEKERGEQTGEEQVYERIFRGSFPGMNVEPERDRDLFFGSYLETYLQRDVRDLTQVGDQRSFLRFVKAAAARTGQLLNLSDLARDADISVPTAKHWLSILETSFQVFLLPPFHTNTSKRLIKAPKLYWMDTGFCAYLTEWSSARTLAAGAMSGAIFETHVLQELLKSYWHRMKSPQLYFYRDKDGVEIDFLLARDQILHPIEVKKGATPSRDWIRSIANLRKRLPNLGEGGVICLARQFVPLDEQTHALPVDFIS